MKIHCITISNKLSSWVQAGIHEYLKRFPKEFKWSFTEIAPMKQSKNMPPLQRAQKESELIFSHVRPDQMTIALDERGKWWTSEQLAEQLGKWRQKGQDINFLIGGADGFAPSFLERVPVKWSLSPLTFPHQMVRLLMVEQLYRAWSILNHHPYHRGELAGSGDWGI